MDNLTKTQRKRNMQNIRSKDTKPERLIMNSLCRRKIYFASHVQSLPGRPDIVFRRKKIAVFIDSDFWHGHPRRYIKPKTNRRYWQAKIKNNRMRDKEVNIELKKLGWTVLRFWEYDIKKYTNNCTHTILKRLSAYSNND